MPRILLLMPTNTYHASDFVDAASQLGVDITVGTNGSQALQALTPGSTVTVDFDDLDTAVSAIEALNAEFPLDAVVASDDESTALAASAATALGLPHNPLEAVLPTRSKLSLRRALGNAGLPSPDFRVLDLGEGFANAGRPDRTDRIKTAAAAAVADSEFAFPCVLKPTFLSASRGVIRADNAIEFRAAAQRIGEILHEETRAGGGNPESHVILMESYIPGREYAVEGILSGGTLHPLAIFDKPDPLEGPYFEETIYVTPSRSEASVQELLVQTVAQAVSALGLREGPVHAELRVSGDEAFIVDMAARAIGGLCPRVLRFGTGVSLEELILRHALGEDFSSFRREDLAGGVMMLPIPRPGVFRAVHGIDDAKKIEGVREINISLNPGQRVVPLPEGNRYLGFIFAHAATPALAETALRGAHATLRLEIEPASP